MRTFYRGLRRGAFPDRALEGRCDRLRLRRVTRQSIGLSRPDGGFEDCPDERGVLGAGGSDLHDSTLLRPTDILRSEPVGRVPPILRWLAVTPWSGRTSR